MGHEGHDPVRIGGGLRLQLPGECAGEGAEARQSGERLLQHRVPPCNSLWLAPCSGVTPALSIAGEGLPAVVVKNGRSLTTPPPRLMSPEKLSGRRDMDAATVDRSKITQLLADFVVRSAPDDIKAPVYTEAVRSFLNWTGCAVGGSIHSTIDRTLAAIRPFAGPGQATVLGRGDKLDLLHAALVNGISSHVFDFDDTHLKTIIHPAGPIASALLPLAETRGMSGRDFLHAFILGVEVECRIGNAVYPNHYDVGWHITGTAGVFGAAAAAGRLLGLNEQQMTWALGIAATQSSGLREMFGTMCKSYHPGHAAHDGLTAALLAARNFTSSERGIEAPRGWAHVLSTKFDPAKITAELGQRFELMS